MRWSWADLHAMPPAVYPVLIDLIAEWTKQPDDDDLEDL